jgi:hypothetical protein
LTFKGFKGVFSIWFLTFKGIEGVILIFAETFKDSSKPLKVLKV